MYKMYRQNKQKNVKQGLNLKTVPEYKICKSFESEENIIKLDLVYNLLISIY